MTYDLVLILLGILAFLYLFYMIYKAGKDSEKNKELESAISVVRTAKEVENEVSSLDDATFIERLSKWRK